MLNVRTSRTLVFASVVLGSLGFSAGCSDGAKPNDGKTLVEDPKAAQDRENMIKDMYKNKPAKK